jgi:hypothetical protein
MFQHQTVRVFMIHLAAPKVEDGRTFFDVVALEAMSKLQHFNSPRPIRQSTCSSVLFSLRSGSSLYHRYANQYGR